MFRYAIWVAVSTEAQAAADKVSLSEQETQCRAAANARGWREVALYSVPGESRTRFVNLRDAEAAIPALHLMLDAAQRGEFDILIMYDYNRLRDLLDPVSKTLSHYNVQIYSLSQPVEPMPPDDFTPYATDTANIMQGMSRIISQAQISDLRRKYKYAMPRRIAERGLPAQIPFGYRKPPGQETNRSAIPIQEPLRAALLIQAKDALLAGRSLAQIVALFDDSGFPPPRGVRWYSQTIRDMLRNPFYAGFVRWGLSISRLDPRTGNHRRDRRIPPSKVIIAKGKHAPLWDETTHRQILAEFARRGKSYRGKSANQLTGLLNCGICGKRMHTFYNGTPPYTAANHVWRCSSRQPHVVIHHLEALEILGNKLQWALSNVADLRIPERVSNQNYDAQIEALQKRRARLEDGYLAGLFSLQSFTGKLGDLDMQIANLENKRLAQSGDAERHAERLRAIGDLAGVIDRIPDYLLRANPQAVNHQLRLLLESITVHEDGDLELHFS